MFGGVFVCMEVEVVCPCVCLHFALRHVAVYVRLCEGAVVVFSFCIPHMLQCTYVKCRYVHVM